MQALLLLANMLALAVLTIIIYRLISAARRRAEENGSRIPDQHISANLATPSEATNKASPPISSGQYEERPPEAIVAPVILATVSPNQVHPAIEEDLPYADPLDGVPFGPEEPVVPCVCGLAYREDSVKWLADYHAGCCIHCGARVNFPERRP